MADQYPITLAEFRAWLETKRPTAVVGRRMHGVECPIGCYLTARGDEFDVVVCSAVRSVRTVVGGRWSDSTWSGPAPDRSGLLHHIALLLFCLGSHWQWQKQQQK